ncbi:MAG: GNAT family N-acetyltransferase [Opitutaceae bacterium]
MNVEIARAKPADASVLSAIACAAKRHWGYPASWLEAWTEGLTLTPEYVEAHAVYTASAAGEIVGFHALVMKNNEAILDHLWVVPTAMNSGVGRALFFHAEKYAAVAGATKLMIEADPHAEGFYLRMGAVTVGQAPSPVAGTPRSLPVMEKRLS